MREAIATEAVDVWLNQMPDKKYVVPMVGSPSGVAVRADSIHVLRSGALVLRNEQPGGRMLAFMVLPPVSWRSITE